MRTTGVVKRTYVGLRAGAAGAILTVLGWRFHTTYEHDLSKGDIDKFPPKFIAFGEPHTHWLDFPMMLLLFWRFRLSPVRFPVNGRFFVPVIGSWLRWMGAIPVDPKAGNGMVQVLVDELMAADRMVLHLPPSGGARRTERWRSGFRHIALQTDVPVFMAYLDASTRTYGYAPPLQMSADVSADMDKIRAFYADKRGFKPANESVIRLKDET